MENIRPSNSGYVGTVASPPASPLVVDDDVAAPEGSSGDSWICCLNPSAFRSDSNSAASTRFFFYSHQRWSSDTFFFTRFEKSSSG